MTKRWKQLRRAALVIVMAGTMVGTTACGYFLYPNRRGQPAGRLDLGVAALDGIGLLFFIVPGAIAFAVDFATGTIYLPGGSRYTTLDMNNAQAFMAGSGDLDTDAIARIVRKHTGQRISLGNPALRVRDSRSQNWQPLNAVLSGRQLAALSGSPQYNSGALASGGYGPAVSRRP